MSFELAAIVLIAPPAVLVGLTPRRWLPIGMVLWFVSPVLLYVAAAGLEIVTRPGVQHPLRTAFYGFMIVSPLLAVPWLVICIIGFGIGFALRSVMRPARIQPTPPSRAPQPAMPSVPRDRGVAVPPPRSTGPVESRMSPDGTIRVDLAGAEWSNTHWVMSPRVIDIARDRTVLDLWGTDWDADADFPRARCIRLGLRRYRHRGDWTVEIDLGAETYQILSEPGRGTPGPAETLTGIVAGLEAATGRADAILARVQPSTAHGSGRQRPPGVAVGRSALLILAMAILAIGVITYVIERFRSPPTRNLTPIPAMPSFSPPSGQR